MSLVRREAVKELAVFYRMTVLCMASALLSQCAAQDRERIDPTWAATYIGTILNRAKTSGSLAYVGHCEAQGQSSDFPILRTPTNKNAPTLQLLRDMFAGDPKMDVREESSNEKIRMFETDVPQDLLNLKISRLSFTAHPDPLTSATQALWVILETPEVQDFMKSRNIGPSLPTAFFFSIPVAPDGPRIHGDLSEVTVAQALDYVLRTYPGFWSYEDCPSENGGRTVFIRFFAWVPPGVAKFP